MTLAVVGVTLPLSTRRTVKTLARLGITSPTARSPESGLCRHPLAGFGRSSPSDARSDVVVPRIKAPGLR